MVGSNKILTVSYGTFSCTLEGFDDSFGTMKAIAEYFRDLAADDRYFGAEPPVPDADMLARIAEREVSRRVEGRMGAKGITLRTGDALPQTAAGDALPQTAVSPDPTADLPGAAEPAPVVVQTPAMPPRPRPLMRQVISRPVPEIVAEIVAEPVADRSAPAMPPALAAAARAAAAPAGQPVVADPLIAPQPVPVAAGGALPFVIPAHPDADSVAAKLQRIRAVVGQGAMPFVAQDFAEDLGETPPQPLAGLDAGALGDSAASQSLSTQWDDLGEAADERAAAAQTATNAEPAPDDAEHQAAGDDSSFDLAGLTAALGAEVPQEAVVAPKPELAPEHAPIRARVIRVRRADADAAPIAAVVAEALATADAPVADTPAADAPAADTPTAGPSGGESDELPDLDALGDLMAMDGLQDDAALDAILAQDAEEIGFDDLPAAPATDPATDIDFDDATLGDGTLPPEAEADLIRELAALEREAIPAAAALIEPVKDVVDDTFSLTQIMAAAARDADEKARDTDAFAALLNAPPGDDAVFDFSAMANEDPTEAAEVTADITPNLRLGRDLLEREPEADAEAMERILSQTDAALNAPETSRRREAIAQLKAAVAATEAARMLGETAPEPELDEVENAFRDDLKQVVRPRRPVGEVSPEQRSERPRPAPLKLVASQRIDIPRPGLAPKPVGPVRPRRVMVQDDEPGSAPVVLRNPASSFAEFAANMGATELPDLLEAAAAYTAFVEGVEDFSRPQLMKKVQDMGEADFSREDGLRSFGTLLRQGRIMKTSNGRFVVNEESRFNPERKTG